MAFPSIPTGGRVLTTNQADTSGTRTFPSLSSLTKNSGDLLIATAGTNSGAIYRDDWGAYGYYGELKKLVVGTSSEVTTWLNASSVTLFLINDRDAASNAGQVTGYLRLSSGVSLPFLLTPVATP